MNNDQLIFCPECREKIDRDAKRCKYCQSPVSWKRHVHFWNITLALIIALISVITTFSEQIYDLMVPPNSELSSSPAAIKEDMISATVFNVGSRPGWVSSANFSISVDLEDYGSTQLVLGLQPVEEDYPILVLENSGELFFKREDGGVLAPAPERIPVEAGEDMEFKEYDPFQYEALSELLKHREDILYSIIFTAITSPNNIDRCHFRMTVENYNGDHEVVSKNVIPSDYYGQLELKRLVGGERSFTNNLACLEYIGLVFERELPKIMEDVGNNLVKEGYAG